MSTNKKDKARDKDVVLLKDLAPRKAVKGGAGGILFGQGIDTEPKESELRNPRQPSKER